MEVLINSDGEVLLSNSKAITADFGIPIEVSTDAGMSAVLTSANVGKAYKFTGTTGTYVNGDIYIVEVGT